MTLSFKLKSSGCFYGKESISMPDAFMLFGEDDVGVQCYSEHSTCCSCSAEAPGRI